jgi:transposase
LDELATGRWREKLPALRLALAGRVHPHQRQRSGELLDHIDSLEPTIQRLEGRSAARGAHEAEHEHAIQLLLTVPAAGPVTAAAIRAAIGPDMTRVPRAAHRASWAGVCPGNRRSAGQHLRGATRKGTPHLKTIRCALAAGSARSAGTYRHAFYHRLVRRRGQPRAMLAVAHRLLVSSYSMRRDHVPSHDLGPDDWDQLHAHRLERHDVRRREALGVQVQLTPAS